MISRWRISVTRNFDWSPIKCLLKLKQNVKSNRVYFGDKITSASELILNTKATIAERLRFESIIAESILFNLDSRVLFAYKTSSTPLHFCSGPWIIADIDETELCFFAPLAPNEIASFWFIAESDKRRNNFAILIPVASIESTAAATVDKSTFNAINNKVIRTGCESVYLSERE